jgi:hypothetical protein
MTNVRQKSKRNLDLIKNQMKKINKELGKHSNQGHRRYINPHLQQIHLNQNNLHHINSNSNGLVSKVIIIDQAVVVGSLRLLANNKPAINHHRRNP